MPPSPRVNLSDPAKLDPDNRLSDFAHRLAKTHVVDAVLLPARNSAGISRHPKPDLLEQMEIWEKALHNANAIFKAVPSNDLPVSRAGEWMLDNFYVVKQTFRQIEENLPASFYNQLPKLAETSLWDSSGSSTGHGHPRPVQEPGLPRIFALAWEWLGYSQSQLDLTQITSFIQDYQQVTPLTIGELWALPSMLRIGILERLVYAAAELTGIDVPKGLDEIPSQFAFPAPANETVVANCFLSLRLLSTTDWEAFFEQTSQVEQILREDPAAVYIHMDFDTRDSYRNAVEELVRYSTFSEEEVALAAVELARSAGDKASARQMHVGFYLQDAGRPMLEARNPLPARIKSAYPPRAPFSPHHHVPGKYRYLFDVVYFWVAHLRQTFGRLACSDHSCRSAWV